MDINEPARELTALVNNLLLNVAVRALMDSHPNPRALRGAWDVAFAEISTAALLHYGTSPANARAIAAELDQQRRTFEQCLPASDGPRTGKS